jgi:hypothetical protein
MLFTVTTINFADRATMSIAGDDIRKAFDLSPVQMGYIFSAFAWSYVLAQLPGGWLLDRFGSKTTYFLGLTLWSLFTLFQGTVGFLTGGAAVAALFVLRLALGAAEAPSFPGDNITIIVQIESRAAVDVVDEIAAVPDVDGLFIGPSDLAAGFAHRGNPGHEDLQTAIARVFERAAACGKPAGILAPVEADARRYLDMGATIVAVGSDLGVFQAGTTGLRERFRQSVAREARA